METTDILAIAFQAELWFWLTVDQKAVLSDRSPAYTGAHAKTVETRRVGPSG
ncbi:hypothetical protein [Sphingobium psychrophilum]|uniref:hypothetical protein n=1 Tax=Sphingobium psychrophilum TaxID=2728834 RepID=UPI00146F2757|nr:hypothetical protein [Sphingobium psychrophilum]